MRMRCTFMASVLSALVLTACHAGPKVVENPLIECANTSALDVVKVELTDTATVLHVNAYYRPHNWIRIDSGTYLCADGEKYALTHAQGITPDSLFWMPESGEASFVLAFQPLPKRTDSFDFIESDCEDCFKLFGIDLTGKKAYEAPDGVPSEALGIDGDASMPEPVFKSGETTVDIHFLYHRKELGEKMNVYVNTFMGSQEEYTVNVNPEKGTAMLRFNQYGPAEVLFPYAGSVLTAPGEHAVVYLDRRVSGWRIVARRKDSALSPFRMLYAEGAYANLNNLIYSRTDWPVWSMNFYSGKFADYKISAEEYAAHVVDTYKALSDSISADILPPLMKERMQLSLKEEAVVAMLDADRIREYNFRYTHNDWDRRNPVKGIDPIKPESIKMISGLFDINDAQLLMGNQFFDYIRSMVYADDAWIKEAGIRTGLIPSLRKFMPLIAKTQAGILSEKDLSVFTSDDDPFYAEALKAMQQENLARLESVRNRSVIEPTPDVPVEKLFEAIIAPYEGKVVFVDFWNTWCGPCRASIKMTEPLKEKELKSDDLVWIYIANETSPFVKYKTMISEIKGKHFRLNDKQWGYICDGFRMDGIPSYVLVDRDGTYELRNDLRDHDRLLSTLKEKISR